MDVVIVAHRSGDVLGNLLGALPAALDGVPARVVVVDNGPEPTPVPPSALDVRVVRTANRGYSAGINDGVAALDEDGQPGRPVLVLNPDLVPGPGCVRPLLAALAPDWVGIAAPVVHDEDGAVSWSLRRDPSLLRSLGAGRTGHPLLSEYVREEAPYREGAVADWAVGAALLVDRRVHDEIGWDESFFLYSEETDLSQRARAAGWRTVLVPAAHVMHIGGGSGRSGRTHAMQIVNRVRLYRRRHGAAAGYAFWALAVLGEASRVARGRRESLASLRALVRPADRPAELRAGTGFLPR